MQVRAAEISAVIQEKIQAFKADVEIGDFDV